MTKTQTSGEYLLSYYILFAIVCFTGGLWLMLLLGVLANTWGFPVALGYWACVGLVALIRLAYGDLFGSIHKALKRTQKRKTAVEREKGLQIDHLTDQTVQVVQSAVNKAFTERERSDKFRR